MSNTISILALQLEKHIPVKLYKCNSYKKLANSIMHLANGNSYASIPNDDNFAKRSTISLFVINNRNAINSILKELGLNILPPKLRLQ